MSPASHPSLLSLFHRPRSSLASLQELKNDGSQLSPFTPSNVSLYTVCPVPTGPIVWCVLIINIYASGCFFLLSCAVLCAFLRIIVCMRLVLLFDISSFLSRWDSRLHWIIPFSSGLCMYVPPQEALSSRLDLGIPPCCRLLFICCRDRSFIPTQKHPWLSLSPTYYLVCCSCASCNQCISTHPLYNLQCLFVCQPHRTRAHQVYSEM